MSLFWVLAAALMVLALALLLPAVLKNRRIAEDQPAGAKTEVDASTANLTILREQLALLDAELATGSITSSQHAQAKGEIERRALEENAGADGPTQVPTQQMSARGSGSRHASAATLPLQVTASRSTRTAVFVGLGIPLLTLGLYGFVGNPQGYTGPNDANGAPGGEVTQAQVEAMVAQLAQRLENAPADQPADPKGWEMLARTYAAMQRFPEADKAYARASALAPSNAQLLADHADVLAVMQGQSAIGAPEKLIQRALQLDPKNPKALALAGSVAFERKDFAAAINFWTQARQFAPAGSEFAKGLDSSLEAAQAAGGGVSNTATSTPSTAATVPDAASTVANQGAVKDVGKDASANVGITGVVSLSPALAAKVAPDDTVFIFARAADGPRMPLAIVRRKASELPISFTLDDSTAMSPEMQLSKFAQVVVGARISKSGNAMPQPGDLVGQAGPLKPPVAQLDVMVNSVQP